MHLGEKLKLYRKVRDLDQFQMAEIVGVSHRKYQDIEKTGIVLKTGDQLKIRALLEENAQNAAQSDVKKEASPDPLAIIASLTESNRILAESNKILVSNNEKLVEMAVSSHETGKASPPLKPKTPVKRDPVRKEDFLGKSKTRLSIVPDQRKDSVKNAGK